MWLQLPVLSGGIARNDSNVYLHSDRFKKKFNFSKDSNSTRVITRTASVMRQASKEIILSGLSVLVVDNSVTICKVAAIFFYEGRCYYFSC